MTPNLGRLRRQQMDSVFDSLRGAFSPVKTPKIGWLRAVRESLGMTSGQLGKRLGVTHANVLLMEDREREGRITLGTLRKAADALGCDVHYFIVPRMSLARMVSDRAQRIAKTRINTVAHTMSLEGQPISKSALKHLLQNELSEIIKKPPRGFWER
ncbi:MAG: mobile mystery protein A [Gemmatimonadales bacterium]